MEYACILIWAYKFSRFGEINYFIMFSFEVQS